MGIEILSALVASALGALLPAIRNLVEEYLKASAEKGRQGKIQEALSSIFQIEIVETKTYRQRLEDTLEMLRKAFDEVDKATSEFTDLMKEKNTNIEILEKKLTELSAEEATLKNKVETLQKVPIEAITHFEAMLNKGDKRSALRDYALFVSGIVASVIVTLILKFYFNI